MAGGFYVCICICFGLATGNIARIKGSSFWMWFLIGAFLPLLGMIAALLYRTERDELRRQCPQCGRICMLYDAICMGCGAELEFPDVAIQSELSAHST